MNLKDAQANSFYFDRLNHSGKELYHNLGFKGNGVNIGLIDTGVANHETFAGKKINITGDTIGHGTAMASCIISDTCGMAPESRVVVYKREDEYLTSVVNGMKYLRNWVGENGEKINIISLSVSSAQNYADIYIELKKCWDSNILVVCSTGNSGIKDITYPAAFEENISVSSCTNKREVTTFSTISSQTDVCWYGENIIVASHLSPTEYKLADGTSPSTAIVASMVALYYCRYKSLFGVCPSPLEAKRYILGNCVDIGVKGRDDFYGFGFATLDGKIHKKIELQINNLNMKVNGYTVPLLQCPIISASGSTLVPLRLPLENAGFSVSWDATTQTATIKN